MAHRPGVFEKPISRRTFIKAVGAAGAGFVLYAYLRAGRNGRWPQIPGGTLDPGAVPKYQTPLLIPPVMPRAGTITMRGRQAGRLLRDLDAAVRRSRSCRPGLPATTVWGYGAVTSASKQGAADPQRAVADDRGEVEPAGARQVDQRPGRRERQLPAAPAAGRPDAALGQPARRRRRGRDTRPTFDGDARPVHRPGADRDARARRGRRRRRERRLRRGVVPARGRQHPRRLRDRGHLVRLLRRQGGGRVQARRGGRGSPTSSTRTTSARRRSGTTTTRSA